jgi:histidinol dehydrogenase
MKLLRHSDRGFEARIRLFSSASSLFDPVIEQRTRVIIEGVAAGGDQALLRFTKQFDGASLTARQLAVTPEELATARQAASRHLHAAIAQADRNVANFARRSLRRNWSTRNAQGGRVGEKYDAFQRVGIYIPGGTAPLVSTAIMTITLARVAGCPQIVVCTPCGNEGRINPDLLAAVQRAGATEIYRVGGAQAIAAMALGTATIPAVQKIFGPGNAYVVAAKRLLFGRVAIDLLPGPSELLVLADDSADPRFVAADLLAQAEHGSGHERVWVVSTSARLLTAVSREVNTQLPGCSRQKFIAAVLRHHGWLIQAKDLSHGIAVANRLAPEHCEVMTRQPEVVARQILTAGALLLGSFTPAVLGDYVAGPSHTLPTGGGGASFAGLTVDQFQRRTSVVAYTPAALQRSLPALASFGQAEGLDAHVRSAQLRLGPS